MPKCQGDQRNNKKITKKEYNSPKDTQIRFSDDRKKIPLKYYFIVRIFSFIIKAHLPNRLNNLSKNVLIICLKATFLDQMGLRMLFEQCNNMFAKGTLKPLQIHLVTPSRFHLFCSTTQRSIPVSGNFDIYRL